MQVFRLKKAQVLNGDNHKCFTQKNKNNEQRKERVVDASRW